MRRMVVSIIVMHLMILALYAQDLPDTESLMYILGAESPEEMEADEVERLLAYVERPLRVNAVSVDKLISSGLMTTYQAVSLVDYRERHGTLVSLSELTSVDGFSNEHVRMISPFISLESYGHGNKDAGVRVDLSSRAGYRHNGEGSAFGYGLKARVEAGSKLCISASASASYNATVCLPDVYSASISYESAVIPLRVVLGDFNARFGQGLVLWNGMTMSGVSSPASFMRTPSGLSHVFSFTGGSALTGVASDLKLRKFKITALLASPGIKYKYSALMPAVNLIWRGRNVQVGFTHYSEAAFSNERKSFLVSSMKTSADAVACVRGVDLFMEMAYDWKNLTGAGVAGLAFTAGDGVKMASMLRFYPAGYDSSWSGAVRSRSRCSNEYAAALSCSISRGAWVKKESAGGYAESVRRHIAHISADAAYYPVPESSSGRSMQLKVLADWSVMLSPVLKLKLRLAERVRTWGLPLRTDVRLDCSWVSSRFTVNSRINLLRCDKTGTLAYLEGGYKDKRLSVFLRHGYFLIDDWDDRIYVYERDAPGSFNIPAFYGRGLWLSLSGMWHVNRDGKLYIRMSLTEYPFMEKKKPGRAELRLQYVMSF